MTANVPKILDWLAKARKGGPDLCVTFEGDGDDALWVQFVGTTLNCAWPFTEAPDGHAKLKPLVMIAGAQLGDWSAGKFAIF